MTVDITYNEPEQQYEIAVDGEVAGHTVARDEGDVVVFPHTVIDERFEGQGLGGKLVGYALDDVRSRGKKVQAHCTYVKHFIEKHPEYQDLRAE
ncbi:GNAT family N-acetyltransferase [Aeromicrobium duanguangcaii]|uniref:N-acetyltransferase n=1 Tax=Aeromicrobium duanguangcaii TaxID=2968086 RepID=A0ABY5KID1_9ACTN|nr:GNAT family N-acetyltransferase [Aeromicrobium duanguangcaii]MCD9154159.1 N-acetyltransferase [Aeromicrobium duanguangcaii]MCL3837894.1 N-acetyltransferase [Aeromicrobium duanguangcaii]UUI68770.1 N-acetyltransferase [Aeromicrobium duanguangcaii]